jgi:hypothetical protein
MNWRNITVDGVGWRYCVGRGAVVARGPNGEKLCDGLDVVTGRAWDIIERGQHKMTSDGAVTPGDISNWIKREAR